LERLASVLQGVISNYETDLFTPLIATAKGLILRLLDESPATQASLRIIADHSRATAFLVSDGVLPSNEGRGYVLRKIMRRAIRHARLLGGDYYVLSNMARAVVNLMAGNPNERDLSQYPYTELRLALPGIEKVIRAEEVRFERTLGEGLKKLEELMDQGSVIGKEHGKAAPFLPSPSPWLMGKDAFKLYDTYGLPLDFIRDAVRDRGANLDEPGFEQAMAAQRERAKASWRGATKATGNPLYRSIADGSYFLSAKERRLFGGLNIPTFQQSEFEGYRQTRSNNCEVLALLRGGQGVQGLAPGEEGEVILDHTPFYAESGGQVGDRGWLYSDNHNTVVADVKGCYYPIQGVRAHQVIMKSPPSAKNAEGWGTLRVGDKVDAVVNTDLRQATMRNHTATHLLQAGLREVLGKHVKQAGSLVAPNHLRFDFSHFTGVADEELQDIEDLINKEVLRNQKIEVIPDVPIDVAINEYKAMALFGEKYGDRVRVIKIGDFSTELCGGTHTGATGEIGLIKVLKEGSVSSGIRRIEAVTGEGSLRHFQQDHQLENVVSSFVGPTLSQRTRKDGAPSSEKFLSSSEALKLEFDKKDGEIKRLQRELDQARMKSASSTVAAAGEHVKEIRGVKVLAHRVDNLERGQMRTLIDQLRDRLGSGVVILGSATDGNVSLIVSVTKDLTGKLQAGKIISPVAQKVGGKGGGRPDMAEAGGRDPGALDAALNEVYGVVESLLGK
jgi:alanyl-tRNA synthetase